jgi:hypothetical protein
MYKFLRLKRNREGGDIICKYSRRNVHNIDVNNNIVCRRKKVTPVKNPPIFKILFHRYNIHCSVQKMT